MSKEVRVGIIVLGAIISLLPISDSLAGDYGIEGAIGVTGRLLDLEGNEAKFNEYRDIRDGLYGNFHLLYDANYYLDFNASDIGYGTQSYTLDGGKWGAFKFFLDYHEIPHNFTFGARSLYSGPGTDNLSFKGFPPDTDVKTWSSFDYSVKRKNYGVGFGLEMIKPFYLDVAISREEKAGIYPLGVAGTSPGGIAIELPCPYIM